MPRAWAISVKGLPPEDSIAVMQNEAKRIGLTIEDDDDVSVLHALYEATGGNPLAMRLTIGQVKVEGISVNDILRELITAEGSELFRTIFDHSWNKTLQADEYARRVLMTLSLMPASASRSALQAGSDIHGPYLRSAVSRLIELSLIDSTESVSVEPRYQLHALTRAFVSRELSAQAFTRAELNGRLIDYFLQFGITNSDTYKDAANVERLESERPSLVSFADLAYQQAAETKNERDWRRVIDYANALSSYLWGRGFWGDRIRLCQQAVLAAEAIDDNIATIGQLILIGRVYLWRRDFATAREYLVRSEDVLKSCDDQLARVASWRLRAQIASREGNYDLAQSLLLDILKFAPLTSDDDGRAATLLELGLVAQREANFPQARVYFEEALRLDEDLGTLEGQAVSLSHLGEVLIASHLEPAAQGAFERGLGLARAVQRLSAAGRCEIGLARLFAQRGDSERAAAYASSAEHTFHRLGMRDLADQARKLSTAPNELE